MLIVKQKLAYASFTLDVDLCIPDTGVTAIFGRSGSGKTSLLRCIAGLEKRAEGELAFRGNIWQQANHFTPACRRSIGYVFQEPSLFQHLDVQGNLLYGQKRSALREGNRKQDFDEVVDLLEIRDFLTRSPTQLSGGEQQRVAIARALLTNPSLLLMDEPLASLDTQHKREIIPYLKNLIEHLGIPVLYVSHSPNEVMQLADHILVMETGKKLAFGPLKESIARLDFPAELDDDLGVVLDVESAEKVSKWNMERVTFVGGEFWLPDTGCAIGHQHRIRVLARDISLARRQHLDTSIQNIISVEVDEIHQDTENRFALIRLKAGESFLIARVTLRALELLKLEVGENIWAQIKSVALLK